MPALEAAMVGRRAAAAWMSAASAHRPPAARPGHGRPAAASRTRGFSSHDRARLPPGPVQYRSGHGRTGTGGLRGDRARPHPRQPLLLAANPVDLGRPRARVRCRAVGRILRRPPAARPGWRTWPCCETGGGPGGLRRLAARRAGRADGARLRPSRRPAGRPARGVDVAAVRPGDRRRRVPGPRRHRRQGPDPVPDRGGPGAAGRLGRLPVNLKLLIEGEEEVGSPHFEALLVARERARLACDVVVVSDTGMIAPDVPSTTVGMRGLVAFDVALRTASIDLHSGMWGGTVPNAALVAARLAAGPARRRGPGDPARLLRRRFERCRRPSRRRWRPSPFDEDDFRATAGGVGYLEGEAGFSPLERIGVGRRPKWSASTAATAARGSRRSSRPPPGFKVAFRLVPDQRPEAGRAGLPGLAGRAGAGRRRR